MRRCEGAGCQCERTGECPIVQPDVVRIELKLSVKQIRQLIALAEVHGSPELLDAVESYEPLDPWTAIKVEVTKLEAAMKRQAG